MKTVQITVREYCQLAGFSYESGYIHRLLRKGDLPPFTLKMQRVGTNYLLEVLKNWYDSKLS
jgi:hypothetical protein